MRANVRSGSDAKTRVAVSFMSHRGPRDVFRDGTRG